MFSVLLSQLETRTPSLMFYSAVLSVLSKYYASCSHISLQSSIVSSTTRHLKLWLKERVHKPDEYLASISLTQTLGTILCQASTARMLKHSGIITTPKSQMLMGGKFYLIHLHI